MLLTGNMLSCCAMKLTEMLLSAHTEYKSIYIYVCFVCFCRLSMQKEAEACPSPGLLRGSSDARTALPQRLAGWTEHQASEMKESWRLWSCSRPSFVLLPRWKKPKEGGKSSGSNVPLLRTTSAAAGCRLRLKPELSQSVSGLSDVATAAASLALPSLQHPSPPTHRLQPPPPSYHTLSCNFTATMLRIRLY